MCAKFPPAGDARGPANDGFGFDSFPHHGIRCAPSQDSILHYVVHMRCSLNDDVLSDLVCAASIRWCTDWWLVAVTMAWYEPTTRPSSYSAPQCVFEIVQALVPAPSWAGASAGSRCWRSFRQATHCAAAIPSRRLLWHPRMWRFLRQTIKAYSTCISPARKRRLLGDDVIVGVSFQHGASVRTGRGEQATN